MTNPYTLPREAAAEAVTLRRRYLSQEPDADLTTMGLRLEAIAKAEGTHRACEIAEATTAFGLARDLHPDVIAAEVRKDLSAHLLLGADDSWSGRGNDLRRSFHDGFRDACRDLYR